MLTTAAKTVMRGTLNIAKKAVPRSQEPQARKAYVDIGGIDINALIDGYGIVLDFQDDWTIYTRTSRNQC